MAASARAHELWGYAPDETLDIAALIASISRHPSGAGLSGVSRPHGQGRRCSTCCGPGMRHDADRELRDAAGRERLRLLSRASRRAVFRRRQDRRRPARRLRGAQRRRSRDGAAKAQRPTCKRTRDRRFEIRCARWGKSGGAARSYIPGPLPEAWNAKPWGSSSPIVKVEDAGAGAQASVRARHRARIPR